MKNIIKKIFPDSLVLHDDFYETTGDLYERMFASVKEDDFNFYLQYLRKTGSPVLDLAAGTGRLSLYFADKGFNIVALEVSPKMVDIFRKKLSMQNNLAGRIHIIRGDISRFCFKKRYNIAIMGYNSFNHLLTKRDQISSLRCINRSLVTGGLFVFEILPVIKNIPGGKKLRYERDFKESGEKIRVYSKIKQDIPKFHKIWWFFEVYKGNQVISKTVSSFIRAEIEVKEMTEMLNETGFRLVGVFNDYNKALKISDKRLFVTEKIRDYRIKEFI